MREVYKKQHGNNPEKRVAEWVRLRKQFASEDGRLAAHERVI